MTRRRYLALLVVALAALLLLCVWWIVEEPPPEARPRPEVASPDERVRGESRSGEVPAVPPAPEVEEPTEPEGRGLRVLDLGTESPLGDIALAVGGEDGRIVRTSEAGWLELERDESASSVTAVDDTLRVAGLEQASEGSAGVLWVGRRLRIEGRVVDPSGAVPSKEALYPGVASVTYVGREGEAFDRRGARSYSWWRTQDGLRPESIVGSSVGLDDRGRFELESVFAPEVGVGVDSVDFHRPTSVATPDVFPPDGVWRVTIELRPVRRFRLRFVDPDGRPLAGVQAQVTTLLQVPRGDAGQVRHRLPRGGYGVIATAETASFIWHVYGNADDSGAADLEVNQDHRAVINAYVRGRGVVAVDVPPGDADVEREIVFPEEREFAPVQLFIDGEVASERAVMINDMRNDPVQLTLPRLHTNEDGMLETDLLSPGMPYILWILGDRSGDASGRLAGRADFVWGGQERIDVRSDYRERRRREADTERGTPDAADDDDE